LEKGEKPKIELPILDVKNDPDKDDISIISTGGTVASIIDYKLALSIQPSLQMTFYVQTLNYWSWLTLKGRRY